MEEKNNSLEEKLELLYQSVKNIEEELVTNRRRRVAHGIWSAIGYVIGLIIAIIVAGWTLTWIGNTFGISPEAQSLKEMLYRR